MSALNTPPTAVGDFGHDFSYAVWTPGSSVLLSYVNWCDDYRDVVSFNDQNELDSYLFGRSGPNITITDATYLAPHRPIRVSVPHGAAMNFNYARVHNPATPIDGDLPRTYYYFIQDMRYVNPSTTEMVLQLDVWQTFSRGMTNVRGFLERGHVPMASNHYRNLGGQKDLRKQAIQEWWTQPEGLDVGTDYINGQFDEFELAAARWVDGTKYSVMLVSTIELHGNLGTVDAPAVWTAWGSNAENLPNGTSIYVVDGDDFTKAMGYLSGKPWAAQGIVSIMVLPDGAVDELKSNIAPVKIGDVECVSLKERSQVKNQPVTLLEGWVENHPYRSFRNGRYKNCHKFMTSPYTFIELNTYTGTPILLRPELMWNIDEVHLLKRAHYVPPSPRVSFTPIGYATSYHTPFKASSSPNDIIEEYGEGLNMQTGFFNFPTFSMPNNGYLNYMAANTHSIAYQHQSAEWTQQRTLAGNQLAYDQGGVAMNTMQQMTNLGINAATAQMNLANQTTIFRGAQSGVNNMIGGAGMGMRGVGVGALGVANAAAGAAIDINQNTQSTGIANNLARGQTGAQLSQAGFNRDTNKSYSDYAARGDYSNAIAGINARVQDARAIPPTVAGQVGGDAFLLASHKWAIRATVKTISPSAMSIIGDYWLRYGYATNRWIEVKKFDGFRRWALMTKLTYWKFKETYISDLRIPESYRQTLRGILEKGVTVWSKPEDMILVDPLGENMPIQDTASWW